MRYPALLYISRCVCVLVSMQPSDHGRVQAFARISKSVPPHHLFHVGMSYGGYLIKV
jgi:hypothetical protein